MTAKTRVTGTRNTCPDGENDNTVDASAIFPAFAAGISGGFTTTWGTPELSHISSWQVDEKRIQTPMAQGRSSKVISVIDWIWTSRLSTQNSLSHVACFRAWHRRGVRDHLGECVDAVVRGQVDADVQSAFVVGTAGRVVTTGGNAGIRCKTCLI